MLKKKKILIPLVVLILGLGAAYSMAKPQKKLPKPKIEGTIYVMPKDFLLNLSDGHFAKVTVALDLGSEQSTGASAEGAATTTAEGIGTLPEEAAVRDIITNTVTGDTESELVSKHGREQVEHEILEEIKHQTDVKVDRVLFPDMTVQ